MKTMKITRTTLKITDEELTYDKAIKNTPKGYKMIDLVTLSALQMKQPLKELDLDFWFWIENYKWNKEEWRPVARGFNDYSFSLSSDDDDLRASRGVYVKVKV